MFWKMWYQARYSRMKNFHLFSVHFSIFAKSRQPSLCSVLLGPKFYIPEFAKYINRKYLKISLNRQANLKQKLFVEGKKL